MLTGTRRPWTSEAAERNGAARGSQASRISPLDPYCLKVLLQLRLHRYPWDDCRGTTEGACVEIGDLDGATADSLRLNAICPYYTMFPLDFPLQQLTATPSARAVLDPFCGRGTTLFASRLHGIRAVGVDINPVASAIAAAKLVRVTPGAVVRLVRRLINLYDGTPVPEGEFWERAFAPSTLQELSAVRQGLLEATDRPTVLMARALLLGILHGPQNKGLPSYLSNQMPRTYASKPDYSVRFWQKRGMLPPSVDVLDVVARRAEYSLRSLGPSGIGRVYCGDAAVVLAGMAREKFDLVVTSPPYYGMRTYVSDQWLRAWFLGGPPRPEYDSRGQIARTPSQEAFVEALARVWRGTAFRCRSEARLAIRFGALPSARTKPAQMILNSLTAANAGWRVLEVRDVGTPSSQRRQAEQFVTAGNAVPEYDIIAQLG